jgi:hypothetical protein
MRLVALLPLAVLGCSKSKDAADTLSPPWTDCTGPTSPSPTGSPTGDTTGTPGTPVTTPSGCQIFPTDNPWNTRVDALPPSDDSEAYIGSIGSAGALHADFGTTYAGAPNGIPYVLVDASVAPVDVVFRYDDESDRGPYPIPPDAPVEGGPQGDGDRHVIALDTDTCQLYELFDAHPVDGGTSWQAGSGAIFDLSSNALRPDGFTSADAAGLPIFPGLVRYEEVVTNGVIPHALRFTVDESQQGYIHPATHYASSDSDPALPPMGLRLRMKHDYDCSAESTEVQVICTALKAYGMFVADNGSNWYISGAPDPRWSDDDLHDLGHIPGSAFEVVDTGPILH